MKKIFCVFVLLILAGISPLNAEDNADRGPVMQETRHEITAKDEKEFLDIFHNVKWGTFKNVSDEVTLYIKGCCDTRDSSLNLLSESGFRTKAISDSAQLETLNRQLKQSWSKWPEKDRMQFDEFIFAERGVGIKFWRIFTKYKVTLMMKEEKVVRTVAVVDSLTILP